MGNDRTVAVTELILISPAALFMGALIARELWPLRAEPAQTAQRIVSWYSGHPWKLWALLIALPLAALVIGFTTLVQSSIEAGDAQPTVRRLSIAIGRGFATRVIAAATLAAGGILAIVAEHMLAN
jgi:hypothetical protein